MTIIATDLDRTLLPNGRQKYDGSMEIFRTIIENEGIMLIYVTGRNLRLVREALREFDPPLPDFVIAEVGTKVYSRKNHRFLEDHQWIRHIQFSTRGWDVHEFREKLSGIRNLRIQEKEKQNEFKLSYYIYHPGDSPTLVGKVTDAIAPACKDATIVYSVNEMQNIGLLDILPRSATKLAALEHLRGKLGVGKDNIIYCGDSGNDTLPLTYGYRAILVRNAILEVRQGVQRIMDEKGIRGKLHVARGYKSLNGYYVSGIVEGLIHFKVASRRYALQGEQNSRQKRDTPMRTKEIFTREEAYERSLDVLKSCMSPQGFLASSGGKDNYLRVWARDGIISSLASLMTEDDELIECTRRTLDTLASFQHQLGFIPSNVDGSGSRGVSYGKAAGRVDASLWYVIGAGQYFKRTQDIAFLRAHARSLAKVMRLLPFWEFNNRHFLYVPMGGDWADEYVNEGYVLYDELLYLQANREYAYTRRKLKRKGCRSFEEKAKVLEKMITMNYWLRRENYTSDRVYNRVIFQKGIKDRLYKKPYLLPCFNPGGYGKRFDGFANSLALHFRVLSLPMRKQLVEYVKRRFTTRTKGLVPAFWPPIKQKDSEWKRLRNNYSQRFRNRPHEYQNGGIWPFINGFWASAVSRTDRKTARSFLDAINWANHQAKGGQRWGFYEFLSSKDFRSGGTKHQGWSATAGIMAYEAAINNKTVFLQK